MAIQDYFSEAIIELLTRDKKAGMGAREAFYAYRQLSMLKVRDFYALWRSIPKPVIEVRKCSSFEYIDGLQDSGTVYFALNHKDFLPAYMEYTDYDHAMDEVRDFINEWIRNFFRSKNNAFGLVEANAPSMDTRIEDECPDSRRYEFELIDIETEDLRYGLVYEKGKFTSIHGNLPISQIALMLKKIGAWEQ